MGFLDMQLPLPHRDKWDLLPGLLTLVMLALPVVANAQGENLVSNGSFEESVNGEFPPWSATAGGVSKWLPFEPGRSADSKDGAMAITIPSPPEGDMAIVHQSIPADALALESTMHFEAWGKSSMPLQLQVSVAFKTSAGPRKVRLMHRGTGDWALLESKFDIPKTADLNSFNVEIIVRPGSDTPAELDGVKLWHEEIKPQYDLPENAHE